MEIGAKTPKAPSKRVVYQLAGQLCVARTLTSIVRVT